ncbi:hypothetical protein FJQ54_09390 [Sandaracinobacter neustonicus]|uniref:DUF1570 domain-containing protein n=1 Tax=Sandaracinobacter neustonicus TaxID=1715348 RepID=A0A501XKZ9_9SPHN|nr:hypothetical protein [Sandaracinobacter neustonicus]TPE61099.1 hypothetical protein FJQ54_09390 [Sandaracinobacter neustonicus]
MLIRLLMGLAMLFAAGAAQAGWLVAETAHFRIYSTMSEKRLRQEAAVLEDYHQLLELLTGRTFPADAPRLDIFLVAEQKQLAIVQPGVGKNVAGFYVSAPGGIFAVATEPDLDNIWSGGRDTLLHEYAHHFMMQMGGGTVPAWYREGFAEYVMTAAFRPDRIEYGGANRERYWILMNLPWEPLEKVLAGARNMGFGNFYAQSWLLTHYLNRVDGMQGKRNAYLKKVAEGGDPVEAFKTEVDPDLAKFQSRLRAYINGSGATLSRFKRTPPEPASVRVTALPKAADGALLPLLSMQMPQKAEDDAQSLARVREATARTPDDPWAKRAAAIAEAIAGDGAVAARTLDALLMESPDDADLLRWRASLYKADRPGASQADITAARKLLVRAWKAAPNDWQVLWAYGNSFPSRGKPLSESVLDVLWKAADLAPQVQALTMKTGVEMARAGHYEHAESLIAPNVNNPHSGGPMMLERNLLTALRSRDKEAVDAALLGLSMGQGNVGTD